jgi:hypothetical protein
MLDGGEISLQYSGDTTVDVTGAAVVVNRCHTVASAATATATRLPTDDPAPVVGPTSPSLPVTGGALVPLLVAAAGVLAAGVAASGVARRRLTPIPIPVRVRAGLRRPQR